MDKRIRMMSITLYEDDVSFLREKGFSISKFVRELVHREVKKLKEVGILESEGQSN